MLLPMRVWDGATRLFHWSVVLLFAISYLSISMATGPNAGLWMRIHMTSGEAMFGVLLFRLTWGFIGSDTARFGGLLRSPAAALRHLSHIGRKEPDTQVGHNEAGGWMVLALLTLLGVQVGTGLFANDDGINEGPLAHFATKALSDQLSYLHGLSFNILAGAVVLHVVAVAAYLVFKGHNLTRAMITGKKRLPAITAAPRMAHTWLAIVTLVLSVSVTVLISRL